MLVNFDTSCSKKAVRILIHKKINSKYVFWEIAFKVCYVYTETGDL